MKLMVIGGGGREHAIIKKLKENPAVEEIYCLPGNGGIAADAVCVPEIGAKDIPAQVEFAKAHRIDYAVVAPDDPLVLGAVDALARRLAPAAARLFGVSGAGAAVFLLGLSGGYPLGAASIRALYRDGLLQKDEAEHLLAFCDNSGPAFAVGALGVGVFGSAGWGMLLWGIHAISAAAVGILFRRRTRGGEAPIKPPRRTLDFGAALGGAVSAAGQTILQIGAYVIFFSALIASLGALGFPDTLAGELALCTGGPLSFFRALFTGALELSSGVGAMAGLPLTPGSLALGEFLLSWGGLCVHGQAGAAAEGLKMRKRLGGKLLQGVFSAALAYAAASIIM